jgi:hypothetical protein
LAAVKKKTPSKKGTTHGGAAPKPARPPSAPKATKKTSSSAAASAVSEAKLLAIVGAQRQLGGSSYPVSLARLAELAGDPFSAVLKAVLNAEKKGVLSVTLGTTGTGGASRVANAMAFVPSDARTVAASDQLLISALHVLQTSAVHAFDLTDLCKCVGKSIVEEFKAAVNRRVLARATPPGVGAVLGKKGALFFFLTDVASEDVPAIPPAPILAPTSAGLDFAQRFAAAFGKLDRETGDRNYVLLHDLRQALPGVSRDAFDSGLAALRRERRFTLDASDGRHDRLTQEQLNAGISEAGNLLVYVARRIEP